MRTNFIFLLIFLLSTVLVLSTKTIQRGVRVISDESDYGKQEEGSSISLLKTARDINKKISLLSEFQDITVHYHHSKNLYLNSNCYNLRPRKGKRRSKKKRRKKNKRGKKEEKGKRKKKKRIG